MAKKQKENQYPLADVPFLSISPKSVHFIGVLGIGISSLAQWFMARPERGRRAQKWAVSGSDTAIGPTYQMLKKAGLKAKIGHKRGNIPAKCGLVIYSRAIKKNNPELKEAKRMDIPALSYPQAVGKLTKFYKTICISGMHGKSTTTALTAFLLINAGLDPTVIIGTRLKEFGYRNFRNGKNEFLVLEADEYKDAFLNYSPAFAIVTNIDKEHLDYFKNINEIKNSFLNFFRRVKKGGIIILNRDDAMLYSLKRKIDKLSKIRNIKTKWYSLRDKEAAEVKKYIKLPGMHNVSNALAVYCLSKFLGISGKTFLKTISEYAGSWRRMEYRGKYQVSSIKYQVSVYDDYAHHPTEIKATLAAFREKFPKSEIVCVFQPHQAERLKLLFKEFRNAFDGADKTIIMPIYKVAGRESSVNSEYDAAALVKSIQKMKPPRKVFYLKDPKNLKKALKILLSDYSLPCPLPRKSALSQRESASGPRQSAVVIMMGAGDIVNYTDSLIKKDRASKR